MSVIVHMYTYVSFLNVASNIDQVLAVTPHTAHTVRPPTTYHENYTS